MAETFRDAWTMVKSYNRAVPATLARRWVQNRFGEVLDRREWSFKIGRGVWNVKAPIAGKCSVASGSNNVTFPGGGLPGDRTSIVGWQLILNGNIPYYTVIDNPDPNTIVLDSGVVIATSATAQGLILQAYFQSEKSDFQKVRVIVDYTNNWQLRRNVPAEELANLDPQRSQTGPPQWLVQLGFNNDYLALLPDTVTDYYGQTNQSTPQPWFESWPRTTAAQAYPYAYLKNFPILSNDDDPLPGFLRASVLEEGALADMSAWPGTPTMPNPMYNPVSVNLHNRRFEDLLLDTKFRDESVTMRQMSWLTMMDSLTYPPTMGANFWQSHAPTELVMQGA